MQDRDENGGSDAGRRGPQRRCPICGRPTEHRWRPFCSKRCADIDLSRWLRGVYAVPVVEPDENDEAGLEEAPPPADAEGKSKSD